MGAVVRLVQTARLPVLRQLLLEEALLRADTGHWCIVNDGAAQPTAVLGLSGCANAAVAQPRTCWLTAGALHAGSPR